MDIRLEWDTTADHIDHNELENDFGFEILEYDEKEMNYMDWQNYYNFRCNKYFLHFFLLQVVLKFYFLFQSRNAKFLFFSIFFTNILSLLTQIFQFRSILWKTSIIWRFSCFYIFKMWFSAWFSGEDIVQRSCYKFYCRNNGILWGVFEQSLPYAFIFRSFCSDKLFMNFEKKLRNQIIICQENKIFLNINLFQINKNIIIIKDHQKIKKFNLFQKNFYSFIDFFYQIRKKCQQQFSHIQAIHNLSQGQDLAQKLLLNLNSQLFILYCQVNFCQFLISPIFYNTLNYLIFMSVQNKNKNLKHLTIEQVIQKSSLRKAIENVLPTSTQNNKNSLLVLLKSKELSTLDHDLHHNRNKKNLLTNQIYNIMSQTSRTSLSTSKTNLIQKLKRQENYLRKQRNSQTLDPQIINNEDNKIKDRAQCKKEAFTKNNIKDKRKAKQILVQNNFLCVKNGLKHVNNQKETIQLQNKIGVKKVMEQYELKNYRTQLHFNGQCLNNSVEDKVHKTHNITGRSHKVFTSQSKKKRSNLLNKYQPNQSKDADDQDFNEIPKRMTSFNSFQRSKIRKRKFEQKQQKINGNITSKASKVLAQQDKKKYQILVFNYPGENQELQNKYKRKRIKTTQIQKLRSPTKKVQIQQIKKIKQKQPELASLRQLQSKIIDNFSNKKGNYLIPQFLKPSLQLFRLENQKDRNKEQKNRNKEQKQYKKFDGQLQNNDDQLQNNDGQLQNNDNKNIVRKEEVLMTQQPHSNQLHNIVKEGEQQQYPVEITSRKLIPKIKQNEENQQLQKKMFKGNLQPKVNLKSKGFSKRINQFINEQQLCGWKDHQQEKQGSENFSINFHTQNNDIFQ